MNSREQGLQNETIAAFYLRAKGYHIVKTNWHYKHLELDIVAYEPEQKNWLFVEVKSAQDENTALRHFTKQKEHNLCQAIESFLAEENIECLDCQLDLIAISSSSHGNLKTLDHIPDVL